MALRETVWRRLVDARVVPPDSYGKIPSFDGADAATERLAELAAWRTASTVKANPDNAQLSVRVRALEDGKLLYMAVPKMATLEPFFLLDPTALSVSATEVADKKSTAQTAQRVGVDAMRPIDIVVCGSVAVNRSGARLGKGAGYSDLEVALLIEAGLVTDETVIVAPVHRLQVIGDEIPETRHDFSVDVILTPDEAIECGNRRRPDGLVWADLTADKIAAIPALRARQR
ncbi:5-formyltetrahydrofolate cyclo-ligase [Prauserella marina]|nr:5-formyltetrahydrofolate cyclo-ligase [Prauserella marina]